ncbi:MAG TPA: PilX N-terminal domain-containing pilus assembly protein [Vicinamibacterales bacterium]|nr:PilX N-terminal domain-containing pilus assembly protein [Vicinamibacterales bacterium]
MPSIVKSSSERGIALVVVLLLMAVLSGLATGFAMNGNIEVQMSTNEVYYAGARAAAEAGLNRAIVEITDPANNTRDWLAGDDGAFDNGNLAATSNADNGQLDGVLLAAGPYALDAAGQYTYDLEILDDDNNTLYPQAITTAGANNQLTEMGEDGLLFTDTNSRLILRATGFGPSGTVVRIARVLEVTPAGGNPIVSSFDAAIIVNGDFEMNGNITVNGQSGSVHANGNLSKTGASGTITGNATTSGTYSGPAVASGATMSGQPTINLPDISSAAYQHHATYKLASNGNVYTRAANGIDWNTTACTTATCKGLGWTHSGGTWSTGKNPTPETYYVEGNVSIGPTQGTANKAVSIIATGNIDVNSNQAKLTPYANNIQFVTDQDLTINASDLDADSTIIEGEIRVRGQMTAGGNMSFQGRVMIQNENVGSPVATNGSRIHGSVTFTYNGTLADEAEIVLPGTPTFSYNMRGWIEQ